MVRCGRRWPSWRRSTLGMGTDGCASSWPASYVASAFGLYARFGYNR
jgi:hypothetical protein